jgi:hypothetical protein
LSEVAPSTQAGKSPVPGIDYRTHSGRAVGMHVSYEAALGSAVYESSHAAMGRTPAAPGRLPVHSSMKRKAHA